MNGAAENGAATGGAAPAESGAWRRLHPLTPVIRFWQGIVVLVLVLGRDLGQTLLASHSEDGGLPSGGLPVLGGRTVAALIGAVALGLGLVALLMFLSWRFTRYRVGAEAVELRQGWLVRQHRSARLDRLQAVDVVQPLLGRLLGLARVDVDVAGGHQGKLRLGYLTQTQAQALRNELLARSAGVRYDTPEAPEAPEARILEISTGRLIGSIVLSGEFIGPVIFAIGLVVLALALQTPAPAFGAFPTLIGIGGVLWQRFSRGFGFRAATSPDGLRLRHGLLEHRAQTVPPGRVQAVQLSQPLLWRTADWWRLTVNVAGYGTDHGPGEHGSTDTTLLPVGSRDEAIAVLSFVLPDLGTEPGEHARLVIDAALSGRDGAEGFVTSPSAARWVDPLSWRRNGFRVTGTALLARHGALRRRLDVVPHARTQSLGVTRGPLQRLLGLASLRLHSTPGPVAPKVHHLAAPVAAQLLTEQAIRARQARRNESGRPAGATATEPTATESAMTEPTVTEPTVTESATTEEQQ